jgi:hypothetical protein
MYRSVGHRRAPTHFFKQSQKEYSRKLGGLEGHKGGLGFFPRPLDLFGGQLNLHHLLACITRIVEKKYKVG